ncbi:MAG: SDR family NAD(P)-dependent oxidoreductase, partial [Burkholderiales bacterium]|nr:SDR family NAD(P)-dependent oxidoreductase [Burkholderiales bacterium]
MTGASSGLGDALAREYASRGALLGLAARRKELLERLADELPGQPQIYPLDVRDALALRQAAADFISRFGPPDVVIGNAGTSIGTLTAHAGDLPVFEEIFAINMLGLVNTFQPFLSAMRERRSGSLVGMASVAGFRGLPGA